MFLFSGLGFLVPVVTLATLMGVQWVASILTGDWGYYTAHDWVKYIAILAAALANQALHWVIEAVSPSSSMIPETGEVVRHHFRHSFLFIPVRWWPTTIVLIGILFAAGLFD